MSTAIRRVRIARTAKRAQSAGARAGLEVDEVIRYVDSSGWTWDVCEVARDLDADATTATAPDPPAAARDAPRFPVERQRHFAAGGPTDGPADLPVRSRTRSLAGAGGRDDPFADDGALYFLSRLGTRKLRRYPPSWHELPRTELEALCWSAEVV